MLALSPVLVDTTGPAALPLLSTLVVAAGPFSPQAPTAKVANKDAASHSRVQFVMALFSSNKGAALRKRPNRARTGPAACSTKRNLGHADRGRVVLVSAHCAGRHQFSDAPSRISDALVDSAQSVKCDTGESCCAN
jgi:hypothetical protein